MNFEATKEWMGRWARKRASHCRLKGALGLILGPVGLAVALGLVYWLLRLFTHDASNNLGDPRKCLWITLAILPVLFVGNWLVPRRNLMEERMEGGAGACYGPGARTQARLHFLMWILFTGPRLFAWAAQSFRDARQFSEMDVHSCAAVLWVLLSNPRKVPFEEVQSHLDWLNMENVLPQLKRIDGVLFLQTPPPGLTLTPDLRNAIRAGVKAAGNANTAAVENGQSG